MDMNPKGNSCQSCISIDLIIIMDVIIIMHGIIIMHVIVIMQLSLGDFALLSSSGMKW